MSIIKDKNEEKFIQALKLIKKRVDQTQKVKHFLDEDDNLVYHSFFITPRFEMS